MPHQQKIHRRPLSEGERVSVHMNLNTGLLTVEARQGDEYGKVIQHRKLPVTLAGTEFRVQDGGLESIRENEQRQVCAYALGRVTFEDPDQIGRPVRFNPFERERFHYRDGNQSTVTSAPLARFWIEENGEDRRPHMHAIVP